MKIAGLLKAVQAYGSATLASAATTTGTAVDGSGFEFIHYTLDVGTLVGAGCTVAVKITESATSGGAYTDITGAAFASVTSANHNAAYNGEARVNPAKPFQKVSITTSGTVTAAPVCCVAMPDEPRKAFQAPVFDVA